MLRALRSVAAGGSPVAAAAFQGPVAHQKRHLPSGGERRLCLDLRLT